MAIQTINTDLVGGEDRFNDVEHVQVVLGAASGTFNVVAPIEGRLVGAVVQSQTTTDGTNTITLAVTNESNSSASMVASTLYDDDPVLTSNTAQELTLSTTEANLDVDLWDNVEVAYTVGGTIAGASIILLFDTHHSA